MKIGIISDIHENFHNLSLYMNNIKKHNIESILFLGDFMNNWIAKILAACEVPVYAIWGNNDGDRVAITKTALSEWSNLKVWFDTFDSIEIENKKIFLTHYPMLAKPMAKSWDFDAVFYGHNHLRNIDHINDCIIVNPWEISAHKTGKATFAVYDTKNNTAEIITLEWSITLKTENSDKYREKAGVNFSKSKTYEY